MFISLSCCSLADLAVGSGTTLRLIQMCAIGALDKESEAEIPVSETHISFQNSGLGLGVKLKV